MSATMAVSHLASSVMGEVVELYVVMYCEACATSVKKAVKKIPGVDFYKIDYYGQKVTVVGNVDRDDVWRRIHKTGRHVVLIAEPTPPKEEPKKEEKKEEKKEVKKEETKSEEKTKIKIEEQKTEETKIVETQEEVKVEEVVTVVETKKEEQKQEKPKVEEKREETKTEVKKEEVKKKEPERRKEPEWVPMFVTAPYYTLPNRFYNY